MLGGSDVRPLYTAVRVRAMDRSVRFYRALGFRVLLRKRTSLGEFALIRHLSSGWTLELNQYVRGARGIERYRSGSEMDHLGFWVADVDRWVQRLARAGGRPKGRPYDATWPVPPKWPVRSTRAFTGRAAYVLDPDGIWIELMGQPPSPPTQRAHRRS